MPFSQNRALAFAQYTLTALRRESPGRILAVSRQDLARVLGVEKLWDKHIDLIRAEAAKYDIGTANLQSRVVFVDLENAANLHDMDVGDATGITNQFERIYGSRAADDMWENGDYRPAATVKKRSKRA